MEPNINMFQPSALTSFEQIRESFDDKLLIRWVDRFLRHYQLASCFYGIELPIGKRDVARETTLLGLALSYRAYSDIALICQSRGLISEIPERYLSNNDLVHDSFISNQRFCEYMLKVAESNKANLDILVDALNKKNSNVIIFAYYIASSFIRPDFTPKNVGMALAADKDNIERLRDYMLAISDRFFAMLVKDMRASQADVIPKKT